MISYLIHHIIFEPIRNFFLGIGGLTRWLLFQFLNILIEKKYPTDVNYYINNKSISIDKNGFDTAQKNMFVAFIILFCLLHLI